MGKIKRGTKKIRKQENVHPHDLLGQGVSKNHKKGHIQATKKPRRNDMDLI
jgi:hypothetical protein